MVFFNAFIFAAICIVVLAILYFILPKRADKVLAACAVISAIISIIMFTNRASDSLEIYYGLITSDEVTVTTADKIVSIPLAWTGGVFYDLDKPPIYAKEKDVNEVANLSLSGTEIRLCKLKNEADYPERVRFYQDGQCYAFLAKSFPYKNACYLFPDKYAQYLLEQVFAVKYVGTTSSNSVNAAPAHFYFGGNLYSYSGEVVFTLPENYKLVGEIKNVGDSFTGLDFEGNVDGYVYMNESDKTIAYFRWMEWDESIDGKEPYLKLNLIE